MPRLEKVNVAASLVPSDSEDGVYAVVDHVKGSKANPSRRAPAPPIATTKAKARAAKPKPKTTPKASGKATTRPRRKPSKPVVDDSEDIAAYNYNCSAREQSMRILAESAAESTGGTEDAIDSVDSDESLKAARMMSKEDELLEAARGSACPPKKRTRIDEPRMVPIYQNLSVFFAEKRRQAAEAAGAETQPETAADDAAGEAPGAEETQPETAADAAGAAVAAGAAGATKEVTTVADAGADDLPTRGPWRQQSTTTSLSTSEAQAGNGSPRRWTLSPGHQPSAVPPSWSGVPSEPGRKDDLMAQGITDDVASQLADVTSQLTSLGSQPLSASMLAEMGLIEMDPQSLAFGASARGACCICAQPKIQNRRDEWFCEWCKELCCVCLLCLFCWSAAVRSSLLIKENKVLRNSFVNVLVCLYERECISSRASAHQ